MEAGTENILLFLTDDVSHAIHLGMLHLVRDGDALHVLLHEHDEVEGVVQVRLLKQRLGEERL